MGSPLSTTLLTLPATCGSASTPPHPPPLPMLCL
ncbi:hypothetical protein NC652_040654 [Populus alba x Populus x berolinensis]|nr:hypothetical protein NC652_040654 [Populus alba x Populus x berolinensis]